MDAEKETVPYNSPSCGPQEMISPLFRSSDVGEILDWTFSLHAAKPAKNKSMAIFSGRRGFILGDFEVAKLPQKSSLITGELAVEPL